MLEKVSEKKVRQDSEIELILCRNGNFDEFFFCAKEHDSLSFEASDDTGEGLFSKPAFLLGVEVLLRGSGGVLTLA